MNFNDKELEEIISKPLDKTEDSDDDGDDDDDDDDNAEDTKADDIGTKEESFVDGENLFKDISVMQKAGLIGM